MQTGRCIKCGRIKGVFRSLRAGGLVCRACYRKVNHEKCHACGNDLPVAARTARGEALCTHHVHLAKAS